MPQGLTARFLLTTLLLLIPLLAGAEPAADRVFTNGAVYTVQSEVPWASAVAVTDGHITYVGDDEGAKAFIGENTVVTDLAGRMLMPGFHDSHMHPMAAGTRFLRCQLYDLEWPSEVLDALRKCATELEEGEWLRGVGLATEVFDGQGPHKSLLDEISPDRAVVVSSHVVAEVWVNSTTLTVAGIDADYPDPEHGTIERDAATGEPTGVLRHEGVSIVWGLIPPPNENKLRVALRHASKMANGFGITSVNAAQVYDQLLLAYRAADQAGEMTLRVQASQYWELEDGLDHTDEMIRGRGVGSGRRFKADAVKFFIDGGIPAKTASLLEPYVGSNDDLGTLNVQPERLNAIVKRLDDEDFQVHMHVVGDRAVRMGLDAIEHAIEINGPKDRRHQLAHIKLINPEDIPRFARLGVVADFQILWAKLDEDLKQGVAALGPDRTRWLMPINSVFKTGARVVVGSDWISESMNPLFSIQIAITRRPIDGSEPAFVPEERVTLEQMIEAYTINGAWLARQEKETGSIEVGKAADLIVLEKNLFEADAMKLAEVKVLLTLLEGEEVYRHADFLAGFAPRLAPSSD